MLTGFKKIGLEDKNLIEKYHSRIVVPFYWHSFVELYTRKWSFYYKEMKDCLVILKKQHLHQPVLYLVCPPISYKGSLSDELFIIDEFRKRGINTNVLDIYRGFNQINNLTKTPYSEFIYSPSDYIEMKGTEFRGLRNEYNQGEKNRKGLIFYNTIDNETAVIANSFYKEWHKIRSNYDYLSLMNVSVLLQNKERLIFNIVCTDDRKMVYMSLIEKLNDLSYCYIFRCNDFSKISNIRYPNQWGFVLDMKRISNKNPLVNMGVGGDSLQDAYKRMLHPYRESKIYCTGSKVVDRELWNSFGNNKLF